MNSELAQARIERKREAATLRREIRAAIKTIKVLSSELGKPKSDTWSLAMSLEAKAMELKILQKGLNAILNRGDEVQLLKRAAKKVTVAESHLTVPACEKCLHPAHAGVCQVSITCSTGVAAFIEPCGCHQ